MVDVVYTVTFNETTGTIKLVGNNGVETPSAGQDQATVWEFVKAQSASETPAA